MKPKEGRVRHHVNVFIDFKAFTVISFPTYFDDSGTE